MITTVINEFGNIDVLVNNAAYENDETYLNKKKKDFLKTFTTDQLNLKLGQIYMDSKNGKKIYEIVGLNELNYGTISVVKSFLQIATGKDEKSFS